MKQIIDTLQRIGLGEYEALIYAALLQYSPATASVMAKKIGLARSSVYTALNSLIAKGLAGTTFKEGIKQFVANDVSVIKEILEKEQKQLKGKVRAFVELQEHAKSLERLGAVLPGVVIVEGASGVKKILWSMLLSAPQGVTLYAIRDEFVRQEEFQFITEKMWQEEKRNKKIITKLILNNVPPERERAKSYGVRSLYKTEVRFLPRSIRAERFAFNILGDTIVIISLEKENLIGIKITNQNLAKNFIQLFEALWQKAEK